tara:strand:- start:205 stop:408 length:204 start_codon:yes stop_codon:yes gene_type:complete
MSEATKARLLIVLIATLAGVGLVTLKGVADGAGCWHGIAQGAYDECRADPECVKPLGFKPEPAECRE